MRASTRFEAPAGLAQMLRAVEQMSAGRDVFVVGGTVRDVLLGRAVHDLDLAVSGDAASFARTLASGFDGHFVEMDPERAIFRVVRRASALDGPAYLDVAALQGELEQDLRRRDFTIDALAVRLGTADVIDLTGGLDDLAVGKVRMTDRRVFRDDPLRLLRCARIAAELGFTVEDATAAEVRERASAAAMAARERQRDELARIFALEFAHAGLRLFDELALLAVVLPEVTLGKGVTQPDQWHTYDVFEHGMQAVRAMDVMLAEERPKGADAWLWDELWSAFGGHIEELRSHLGAELSEGRPRSLSLKMAALLHDVGKPATRSVDDSGRIRFFGHADEGAEIAARVLRRLRFSAAEVRWVALLVAEHLRPVQLAQAGEAPTKRALYRFNRALGEAMPDVLLLALADAAASRGPSLTRDGWARQVGYMNSLLVRSTDREAGILRQTSFLDGHEIMKAAGIPPGRLVGQLLDALHEAEAVGDVTSAGEARRFVKRLAGEMREAGTGEG